MRELALTPYARLLAAALLATVAAWSCVASTEPVSRGDLVMVGGGELTSIAVVSISAGRVVKRIGPIPRIKDRFALSPDSSTLFVSSFDHVSPVTLTAIDTRSLRIAFQEPMARIGARSAVGNVLPLGGYAFAVSPDGRKLVMNGLCDSVPCVVVVDASTRTPVRIVPAFATLVGGITALGASRDSVSQRVLLLGSRVGAPGDPRRVIVLAGPDLALADSMKFPVAVGYIAPMRSGTQILAISSDSVFKIDLASLQILAWAPRLGPGPPCLSPSEDRLYLADPGYWPDSPGSGHVQVYDESLRPLASIDLRSGADVPTLNDCAVSSDGRYLLVSSGTASVGPLYEAQRGRLFVIDRATGTVARTIDMGDWLSRDVFAF